MTNTPMKPKPTPEMIEAAVAEVRKAKSASVWDRWTDYDAVAAMLSAALSVGETIVKPLEWKPESTDEAGYSSTIAKTPFGFMYDVWRIKEGALWNGVGLPKIDGEPPQFDSREAAMSAANEDYTARVLELVESRPLGGPVAWQWLHKHSLTGTDMWLDTESWMGRKTDIKRPLYAAPSAPEGWLPIETAPKDGTEILAYGYARCDGSRYANGQHIAWWDAELGWTGRDPDDRVTLHPSHWRPLPAPPSLGEKP